MITFLNLPIRSYILLKQKSSPTEFDTQFKEEKRVQKLFCLKYTFRSGLIGNFHIHFTVDDVFEILVSTKEIPWSFQGFNSIKTIVNHLVSTNKGYKKASRAFQLVI